MDHPSLDSLDQYAADKVQYYIEHGSTVFQQLEEHLAHCDECGGYVDFLLLPKRARIQRNFRDLAESLNARGITIPKRYQNGKACPNEEQIAEYISSVSPFWSVWKVKRHLRRCAYCASVVQGVWEPVGVEPETSGNILTKSKSYVYDLFRDFRLKPAIPAVAIIFVGVLTVGALYLLNNDKWSSRVRGKTDTGQELVQLVKPENEQTVDISDFRFQWELTIDIAGAHYEVVIWDRSGVPRRFPAIKTELPGFEVDILQRGKTYRWMVEVYVGDDKTSPSALKAQSKTWSFHTRELRNGQ